MPYVVTGHVTNMAILYLNLELESSRDAELESNRDAELESSRDAELESNRDAELESSREAELESNRDVERKLYVNFPGAVFCVSDKR
jgi:hypothetical protein